jgi:amidophosphoribosyltransferase
MCGIVGVISKAPVNQLIYDALLLLQHRGQDAAGIVTAGPDAGHASSSCTRPAAW